MTKTIEHETKVTADDQETNIIFKNKTQITELQNTQHPLIFKSKIIYINQVIDSFNRFSFEKYVNITKGQVYTVTNANFSKVCVQYLLYV